MAKRRSKSEDVPPEETHESGEVQDQPQSVDPDVADEAEMKVNIDQQPDRTSEASERSGNDSGDDDENRVLDEPRELPLLRCAGWSCIRKPRSR